MKRFLGREAFEGEDSGERAGFNGRNEGANDGWWLTPLLILEKYQRHTV